MKKTVNLTKLNYPVSIPLLRDECLCMEQYSKPSLHKDHPTFQTVEHNVGWNVFRWNDIEFNSIRIPVNIQQVFDKLYSDLNIRHFNPSPRFYYLPKGSYLPSHKDDGTQCSVNFLLSGNEESIIVEGDYYTYSQGVLNTQVLHSVDNTDGTYDRMLLKFSIFDFEYNTVVDSIPDKWKL